MSCMPVCPPVRLPTASDCECSPVASRLDFDPIMDNRARLQFALSILTSACSCSVIKIKAKPTGKFHNVNHVHGLSMVVQQASIPVARAIFLGHLIQANAQPINACSIQMPVFCEISLLWSIKSTEHKILGISNQFRLLALPTDKANSFLYLYWKCSQQV